MDGACQVHATKVSVCSKCLSQIAQLQSNACEQVDLESTLKGQGQS